MSLNIVVLIKQVPDTANVGPDAMNPDGTVNRVALPAIFNPEDLQALEMALEVKERLQDVHITVLTMGPDRAAIIVRDALSRGADRGIIISDRRFAGADTLATSYAISCAIKKIGKVNLIMGGRQAIDGDTAQVGPQVAEKMSFPQITYAEELVDVSNEKIRVTRRLENGVETVECAMPCMVTVTGSAREARYPHAHRLIKYSRFTPEIWTADDVNPDFDRLGKKGSPTNVKKIDNVVLAHKDNINVEPTNEGLDGMVKTLINEHIIG